MRVLFKQKQSLADATAQSVLPVRQRKPRRSLRSAIMDISLATTLLEREKPVNVITKCRLYTALKRLVISSVVFIIADIVTYTVSYILILHLYSRSTTNTLGQLSLILKLNVVLFTFTKPSSILLPCRKVTDHSTKSSSTQLRSLTSTPITTAKMFR